jgi:hypothetical protein
VGIGPGAGTKDPSLAHPVPADVVGQRG